MINNCFELVTYSYRYNLSLVVVNLFSMVVLVIKDTDMLSEVYLWESSEIKKKKILMLKVTFNAPLCNW